LRLAAVVVAAATVATGCGVPLDDGPRPIPDERVPFELLDPAPIPTTPPSTAAESPTATVFMVAGDRLAPVIRSVPAPASPEKVLEALLGGVVPDEAARNLRSAIAGPTQLSVAADAGAGLRVELTPAFLTTTTNEQVLAVAQIVYTLTGLPGVDSVSFTVSGRPVEVPAGDGTLKSGLLRRADFASIAKL
jgi:hypothetical protein